MSFFKELLYHWEHTGAQRAAKDPNNLLKIPALVKEKQFYLIRKVILVANDANKCVKNQTLLVLNDVH